MKKGDKVKWVDGIGHEQTGIVDRDTEPNEFRIPVRTNDDIILIIRYLDLTLIETAEPMGFVREKGDWGDTKLKVDLRNILREFCGQMKDLQKTDQPEFNKGLDGICIYDEAIIKILERTAVVDMQEALKEITELAPRDKLKLPYAIQAVEIADKALAKAEGN